MGLGALLRRAVAGGGGAPHVRADQTLAELLAENTAPTAAGVSVTSESALRLGAVWGAVRLLADTVSSLPVDVERDGQAIPTPPLFVEPAAGQPVSEWLDQAMRCLLLTGNAVGVIVDRDGAGLYPRQVELAHPDRAIPDVDPAGVLHGWRIEGRYHPRADVWHCRAFSLPGRVLGLSPIGYARETIGLGLAAERYGASFLGQGAVPTGVLKVASPDVEEDEIRDAKAAWKRAQAERSIAVLTPAIDFDAISINAEESQFLATISANVAAIARIFGVPAELLSAASGDSLTYANVESRGVDFLKFSVQPWITRLESSLSRLLPPGQRVRFNVDGLLRSTTLDRYTAHETGLRAGWLTVDEVRALENLPPLQAPTSPPPAPASDPGEQTP